MKRILFFLATLLSVAVSSATLSTNTPTTAQVSALIESGTAQTISGSISASQISDLGSVTLSSFVNDYTLSSFPNDAGYIAAGDVTANETDPAFTAWLAATPPIFSETEPAFNGFLTDVLQGNSPVVSYGVSGTWSNSAGSAGLYLDLDNYGNAMSATYALNATNDESGHNIAATYLTPTGDGSGLSGVQFPLVAGTDYQTPLVAGTDYQTPLIAGTDYIAVNGVADSLTINGLMISSLFSWDTVNYAGKAYGLVDTNAAPSSPSDPGISGQMIFTDYYIYRYFSSGGWKRTPVTYSSW